MGLFKANGSRVLKVMICMPAQDTMATGCAFDLARMIGFTCLERPDIQVNLLVSKGTLLPMQRTDMVVQALDWGATHIFFIDSDMRFPKDALLVLLHRQEAFVAASYSTRREPFIPTVIDLSGQHLFLDPDVTGLVPVQHCGLGLALIDTKVFEKVDRPWFMLPFDRDKQVYIGEDVFFCAKVRNAGFTVFVDTDLSRDVVHLGEVSYRHEHTLHFRELQKAAAKDEPAGVEGA